MSWVDHLLQGATIIDAIQTLGLFVLGIYSVAIRKAMSGLKEVQLIDAAVQGVDKRLAAVEHSTRQAPTHGDLAAIYSRINLLAERQSETVGVLSGIQRGLDRVEEHLLNRKD